MTLTRRAVVLATAPAVLTARRGRAQSGARPNILLAIADDQSWLHTSSAGDPVVKTPNFDRVAQRGVRFTHAFCSSPSCTPSRGAILSGQHFWRLREGGNLRSTLPKDIEVYPDLLAEAGYHVGFQGKGWGPGDFKPGGRTRNPAGPAYKSFDEFLAAAPGSKPFCFWFGSTDPHRPYEPGSGLASGMKAAEVRVPAWLPDDPVVRADILDYYFEIQRFDRDVGRILDTLERLGGLENTLVVVTSDNGMPFPRAKTNLYDSGTRMPLAIAWPARIRGGRVADNLVSLTDLAPTFLEAAGLRPRPMITGRSLMDLLAGRARQRNEVFVGRERHTRMRAGGAGYPMRAIRTRGYLYIRNYEPDRWPAGDPEDYGDIDNSPSKEFIIESRGDPRLGRFFEMACAKRPAEELYDLARDPSQANNIAAKNAAVRAKLRARLDEQLKATGDPRATGAEVTWDTQPYYGGRGPVRGKKK